MKKIIFLTTGFVFAKPVFSQINESDTAKFQLKTTFTGNYQTGNVEVLTLKGKLDFAYTPVKNIVFKSQNNSLYQSFYNVEADNDLFSRNYLYFFPQHKIYPYAIGYVSTNYRRKIDLRYFAGAGLTYQLLQAKNHIAKISANAVYEQTKFTGNIFNYNEYNGRNNIDVWRASIYVGGWDYLFNNHLRFIYDAYWQPAFNNTNNYRTQLDLGFDFPLWKGLTTTVFYTYAHENVVVQRIKQTDNILTFGFSYSLKIKQQ